MVARSSHLRILLCLIPALSGQARLAQGLVGSERASIAEDSLVFAAAFDGILEAVDRGIYHGAVCVVEVGGERLLEAVVGTRTQAPSAKMERDTIFQIYSMTKPVTAVAALILLEAGAFAMEDPVGKYLPALSGLDVGVEVSDSGTGVASLELVPAEHEMTVLDLFRHTAGLTYGLFGTSQVDRLVLEAGVFDPQVTNESLVEILGTLPLKSQPGTRFEYSLASDVLGRLVEVLSGVPLDEYMADKIFGPLGMKDTAFFVPEEKLGRLATVYRRGLRGLIAVPLEERQGIGTAPGFLSGGGGLFSTADDYVAFCNLLLEGGARDGTRILQPDTVERMLSDQLREIRSPRPLLSGGGFGLGLAVTTRDPGVGPQRGTGWWGGLAGTGFWIDRQESMVGVFLIQNMSEPQHTRNFRSAVYRDVGR